LSIATYHYFDEGNKLLLEEALGVGADDVLLDLYAFHVAE